MSDTGGFPLVGGSPAFPGKNNVVRDSSSSNSFGWENLNVGNLSVVGGYRNRASVNYSYLFGASNIGSGLFTFAFGGSNTSSGGYASSFGFGNLSSGLASFSCGQGHTASGNYSFVAGLSNTVANTGSAAFGTENTVTGSAAYAIVFGRKATASRYGEVAHGINAGTNAQHQHGWLGFANQSTSATPVVLYLDGAGGSQNAVLAAGARWNCTLKIQACTTGAIDKDGSWEYAFTICRPTTAATTIIRTTPLMVRSDGSNAGAPPAGWSVAITADTTNGCLQIQVTGDTDTINWTAALHYVQSIRV